MTEPTYAELDSIDMDAKAIANQNPIGTPFAWRKAYLTALTRAILAKWGSPVVAGDVTKLVQSAQAQAEAVPLTDEQIGSLACMDGLSNIEVPALQWLVREVEYLHGIKGGQHGTNT